MYLRLVLLLVSIVVTLSQGRKCKKTEFYQAPTQDLEKGTCVKCPTCELGQGWDNKVRRSKNSTLGFLECYPCKPCDDNYYRSTDSNPYCSLCKKDCESGNRTTAIKCGGVNIGSCGDCFPGFVPANKLEKESICMPDPAKTTTALLDINLNVRNVNTVHNHGMSSPILILIGASIVAVAAVCSFTVFMSYKYLKKRKQGTAAANVINSGTELLGGSNDSAVSELIDIETDGIPAPRAELPHSIDESCIGLMHEEPTQRADAILVNPRGVPSGQSRHGLSATVKQGRNRTLSKNDRVLDIVASNIGVKGLLEVYRSLGITNATYEPEEELYRQGRQSFKSYVLNVLLEWLKHDGKTATLERLCNALDGAGCRETVDAVQQYIEENMPQLSTKQHVQKEQGSWPKLDLSELIDDIDGDPVS